jgi:hypothetical protein
MRVLSSVLFAILVAGCYNYNAIDQSTPPQGMVVSLDLNDQGTASLASKLGPGVERMRGKVVNSENGDLMIAVDVTETHGGVESYWNGENVAVSRAYISRLRERELSRGRTAVLIAAIVLGAVVIGAAAAGASILDLNGGGGPPAGQ